MSLIVSFGSSKRETSKMKLISDLSLPFRIERLVDALRQLEDTGFHLPSGEVVQEAEGDSEKEEEGEEQRRAEEEEREAIRNMVRDPALGF